MNDTIIDYLNDSMIWIVCFGVLGVVVFGGLWINTGRKQLLYAGVATVALTGLLLAMALLVPTDRKRVRATLFQVARDVETNDVDAIVDHFHTNQTSLRDRARQAFAVYRVDRVTISNVTILVEQDNKPPRAEVRFNLKAVGGLMNGNMQGQPYLRFLIVTFYKVDDRWVIGDVVQKPWMQGYQEPDE